MLTGGLDFSVSLWIISYTIHEIWPILQSGSALMSIAPVTTEDCADAHVQGLHWNYVCAAARAIQIGVACIASWSHGDIWPKLCPKAISGFMALPQSGSVLMSASCYHQMSCNWLWFRPWPGVMLESRIHDTAESMPIWVALTPRAMVTFRPKLLLLVMSCSCCI